MGFKAQGIMSVNMCSNLGEEEEKEDDFEFFKDIVDNGNQNENENEINLFGNCL